MVHDAHAPLTDLLQQLVGTDLGTGLLERGVVDGDGDVFCGFLVKCTELPVCSKQFLDLRPQGRIVGAGTIQEFRPLIRLMFFQRRKEYRLRFGCIAHHGICPYGDPLYKTMRIFSVDFVTAQKKKAKKVGTSG
jgi:hypothetical protein